MLTRKGAKLTYRRMVNLTAVGDLAVTLAICRPTGSTAGQVLKTSSGAQRLRHE